MKQSLNFLSFIRVFSGYFLNYLKCLKEYACQVYLILTEIMFFFILFKYLKNGKKRFEVMIHIKKIIYTKHNKRKKNESL